jgi:UDPglucose 6-dehydrogenase
MKVAFVGLGKLGMPCAEAISKKGIDVTGFDTTNKKSDLISIKTSIEDTVKDRDIVFIAVPTPHEAGYDGQIPTSDLPVKDFDYQPVKDTLVQLDSICNDEQMIVLISTVLPGTVRRELNPLYLKNKIVYNPYLIAMGTVEQDFYNPEMIMIGTKNGMAGTGCSAKTHTLSNFYQRVCDNNPRNRDRYLGRDRSNKNILQYLYQ